MTKSVEVRRLRTAMAGALAVLAVSAAAAMANTGPSGSHYPSSPNGYGVACAAGSPVDGPANASAFVYNQPNGTEVCVDQRDENGSESGGVSGRVWATPDGHAHADAPGGGGALGDRIEADFAANYIRVSSHWVEGEPLHQETTVRPLEGRITHEAYGSDSGYYSNRSETWVDGAGLHSESSHYDYYGNGWTDHGAGPDGVRYASYSQGAQSGESENVGATADANGVTAHRGQAGGDTSSGVSVLFSPSGGIEVIQHQAGFNNCGNYGASRQGVTWHPVGSPGSVPTIVSSDDRPPCP